MAADYPASAATAVRIVAIRLADANNRRIDRTAGTPPMSQTNDQDDDPATAEARIVRSWHRNAEPWTTAVREARIDSRRLVTDRAVVDTVTALAPCSALDIGCGEGWLARALAAQGIDVIGVDTVPALIERAREAGGGDFRPLSYADIAAGRLERRVDLVVCNFSLLGDQSVTGLLAAVPALLNPHGTLVVQTLHPLAACGDQPYEDGWRRGSWDGFDPTFTDPAPWYFRTLSGWVDLLRRCGLRVQTLREPLHPATRRPASVIFVATADH